MENSPRPEPRRLPSSKKMNTSTSELLKAAHKLSQDVAFRQAIWAHCEHRLGSGDSGRLSTRIHSNDQMLRHSIEHFQEVNRPLSQYFHVALQQHDAARQIMRLVFDRAADSLEVLDFACGYGRLLRFLSLSHAPERVWASDIQRDAVEFVVAEFGVNGIESTASPERFEPGRQFDFIWVASLFSHLPDSLFRAWLARLNALLTPDGVLCFSVHDECLLPPGVAPNATGIHFLAQSENAELDARAYGTTYVSEAYVGAAIREACGGDAASFRLPRGLANEQDIYVVSSRRGRELGPLAGFRRGTWGWVDECRVSATGELLLEGWASSLDSGTLDRVEIAIDGKRYSVATGSSREAVGRVLNDDRLLHSGWEFRCLLRPDANPVFLQVSARYGDELALLYAGRMKVPNGERSAVAHEPSLRQKIGRRLRKAFEHMRR